MRKMGWASVAKGATIKAPDGRVLHLAHHPQSGDRLDQMRVDLQLCGHVHEAWKRAETSTRTSMTPPYKDYVYALPLYNGRVINVGVDVRDFEPKTLQELLNG
jgi:predicted MPP superfamily phosphohydrolase